MTRPSKRHVEFVQLADSAGRLNYRYIPIGDYLEIALRNARVEGPFRKLAITFCSEESPNAGYPAVCGGPDVCEIEARVPADLLRPDAHFAAFLRATKRALLAALELLRRDGQWHSDALEAAVNRMDQNSGVLECRLDFAGAVHNGVAVEILFRLFADHLEMVAKVTTGSEVAEHQLIATEPGAVIPYLANFFPVTSVQIARRRVSVRGSGKRVLKELSLP